MSSKYKKRMQRVFWPFDCSIQFISCVISSFPLCSLILLVFHDTTIVQTFFFLFEANFSMTSKRTHVSQTLPNKKPFLDPSYPTNPSQEVKIRRLKNKQVDSFQSAAPSSLLIIKILALNKTYWKYEEFKSKQFQAYIMWLFSLIGLWKTRKQLPRLVDVNLE